MPDPGNVITISGLLMPPSSNSQYNSFIRKGKICHVSSRELMWFKRRMGEFWLKTLDQRKQERDRIHCWIEDGFLLSVSCNFFFKRSKLFTKEDKVKKMDVSNRLKAIHDEISRLYKIDDSYFFDIHACKSEENSVDLADTVTVSIGKIVYWG